MVDDVHPRRVREGLEACRPGSDDLRAPELADVARAVADDAQQRVAQIRIGAWDAAIGQAIDQVEVPPGLSDRILARLREASTAAGSAQGTLSGALAQATSAEQVSTSGAVSVAGRQADDETAMAVRLWPLRHWSGIALSALAAAAIVVFAGYWLSWESDTSFDLLAEQWHDELTNQWQPVARAPRDLPFPTVMRILPTRWQRIRGLTPMPVVAYELTDGKTSAMLYATRMSRPGLATAPPLKAQFDTGGKAVGYWQSGNIVYVLVVNDVNRYGSFVRPSQSPLAVLSPIRARAA